MLEHDTPTYSQLFHCLYDQQGPVGNIGDGTHYSVFRCASFRAPPGQADPEGFIQDFAVIWDVDHDTRIIPVIEALYMKGLLYAIAMIGERKGSLTIVLEEVAAARMSDADRYLFEESAVRAINRVVDEKFGDFWSTKIGVMEDPSSEGGIHQSLIQDYVYKTFAYVHHIDHLWDLGTKPWK